jgi:hypothetical protein
VLPDDDIAICAQISGQLASEQNLRSAYIDFRKRKDLPSVDLSAEADPAHKVHLCMECLLDCYRARRVEANNYELDEVSCYRGTLMEGIGIRQEGLYPRKQKDELGLQRKRGFSSVAHHGFTRGLEALRQASADSPQRR